jgi:hypothetical protein
MIFEGTDIAFDSRLGSYFPAAITKYLAGPLVTSDSRNSIVIKALGTGLAWTDERVDN